MCEGVIEGLGKIGTESAKQALIKLYQNLETSLDAEIRRTMLNTIASIEAEQLHKHQSLEYENSARAFFKGLWEGASDEQQQRDAKLAWCQIDPDSLDAKTVYERYINNEEVNAQCVEGLISMNSGSAQQTLIGKLNDPDFHPILKKRICEHCQHSEMALSSQAEQQLRRFIRQADNEEVEAVAAAYSVLAKQNGDDQVQLEEFIVQCLEPDEERLMQRCGRFLIDHAEQFKNSERIKNKLRELLDDTFRGRYLDTPNKEFKLIVASVLVYLDESVSAQDLAKLFNKYDPDKFSDHTESMTEVMDRFLQSFTQNFNCSWSEVQNQVRQLGGYESFANNKDVLLELLQNLVSMVDQGEESGVMEVLSKCDGMDTIYPVIAQHVGDKELPEDNTHLLEEFIPILIDNDQQQLLKRAYNSDHSDRELDVDKRHTVYSLILEDQQSVLNHFQASERGCESRQHAWQALKQAMLSWCDPDYTDENQQEASRGFAP